MRPITYLIAEAAALAGGNLCASGHDWIMNGGRACPHECSYASQPVFQCQRCGEFDYGEPGGPGHEHCSKYGPCDLR